MEDLQPLEQKLIGCQVFPSKMVNLLFYWQLFAVYNAQGSK